MGTRTTRIPLEELASQNGIFEIMDTTNPIDNLKALAIKRAVQPPSFDIKKPKKQGEDDLLVGAFVLFTWLSPAIYLAVGWSYIWNKLPHIGVVILFILLGLPYLYIRSVLKHKRDYAKNLKEYENAFHEFNIRHWYWLECELDLETGELIHPKAPIKGDVNRLSDFLDYLERTLAK